MPAIEHIFVLMLENRSFDHMLGFSGIPGLNGLNGEEFNCLGDHKYKVRRGAPNSLAVDPGHAFKDVLVQLGGKGVSYPAGGPYPEVHNSGFVDNYAPKDMRNPDQILRCFTREQLPVLVALAEEFAVCDNWFASMPGPTWPNRFFAHAASAGGLDDQPTTWQVIQWLPDWGGFVFPRGTLLDRVPKRRIYRHGSIALSTGMHNVNYRDTRMYRQFRKDVNGENGAYDAPYTFIEPTYSVETLYTLGNSQHPLDNMEGGELFIKNTYEAIRNSPLWTKSLLIITWDEHGGFYDHVTPPGAPAPGDGAQGIHHGFKFDQLGARVPAVVVSPFIARGHVDHRKYDHATIPATVERCFNIKPMTERDRTANDVLGLLTLTSPRHCPETLPEPAAAALFAQGPSQDEIAAAVAARAAEPMDGTDLSGFVVVAAKMCRELFPEDRALVDQAQNCHTCGEAQAYIGSVTRKVEALEAAEARAAGKS